MNENSSIINIPKVTKDLQLFVVAIFVHPDDWNLEENEFESSVIASISYH